jgi:alkylated DNA repair dioxygenase AlkB
MNSLFPSEKISFDIPDAEIVYHPGFFDLNRADELYNQLKKEIPWQQDTITVFGKTYLQPRLTALFGNEGKPYAYSNIVMQPHPWTPLLVFIKEKIEEVCGEQFTTVLLNYYRDGNDSNGWHADNEKELGNTIKTQKLKITLEHGSLLVMKGTTQHYWKHQIPKTAKPIGSRINLTFRFIK